MARSLWLGRAGIGAGNQLSDGGTGTILAAAAKRRRPGKTITDRLMPDAVTPLLHLRLQDVGNLLKPLFYWLPPGTASNCRFVLFCLVPVAAALVGLVQTASGTHFYKGS